MKTVAEIDIDIIIDEGIDSPTAQAEQFETIVQMLPGLAPAMADPARAMKIMEFVTQASSLRDKDKLLEILKGDEQQGDPAEAAAMQAQMAMQMEQQAAQQQGDIEIQKAQINAQAKVASAQIAAEADKEIALYKAGLEADLNDQKAQMEARNVEQKTIFEHEAKMRAGEVTGENEREAGKEAKEAAQLEAFQLIAAALRDVTRPKTKVPIRDENGFIVAVEEVLA